MRRLLAALASGVLLAAMAACTATAPSDLSRQASHSSSGPASGSQALAWDDCGGGFECATLQVPLDHVRPAGPTIGIALARLPATGGDRLGSLVVNPGGPGASGIDYARYLGRQVSPAILESYDLVGFDPRGTGASDPIECLTDQQLDELYAVDTTPDSATDVDALVAASRAVRAGCEAASSDLLPHVGTDDAARDLDLIRAALGQDRLDYLGKSYGTFLGLAYADLFPDRVGRFVLDGIVPPGIDAVDLSQGQAVAFEKELRRFVEDCDPRPDCPLPDGADAALAAIREFLAGLERQPIPGQPGRDLDEALATYTLLSYMYLPEYDWPALRSALGRALDGDGAEMLDLLDARVSREPDGSYADNSAEAFYAISCHDWPFDGDVARVERLASEWAQQAPTFGAYLAWSLLPCEGWMPRADPAEFDASGIPPMLLVSTTWDPATPLQWAEQVSDLLPSSRLVTWDADGHTAYAHGSACVDNVVETFLVDGDLPSQDVSCE